MWRQELIVDTCEESAAVAAESQALSTMAWNHCPRSMEYAKYKCGVR
jgi:CxxC motif-containing protein